jgi:hypothetical protein
VDGARLTIFDDRVLLVDLMPGDGSERTVNVASYSSGLKMPDVRINYRSNGGAAQGCEVEVSDDGETWRQVYP